MGTSSGGLKAEAKWHFKCTVSRKPQVCDLKADLVPFWSAEALARFYILNSIFSRQELVSSNLEAFTFS